MARNKPHRFLQTDDSFGDYGHEAYREILDGIMSGADIEVLTEGVWGAAQRTISLEGSPYLYRVKRTPQVHVVGGRFLAHPYPNSGSHPLGFIFSPDENPARLGPGWKRYNVEMRLTEVIE